MQYKYRGDTFSFIWKYNFYAISGRYWIWKEWKFLCNHFPTMSTSITWLRSQGLLKIERSIFIMYPQHGCKLCNVNLLIRKILSKTGSISRTKNSENCISWCQQCLTLLNDHSTFVFCLHQFYRSVKTRCHQTSIKADYYHYMIN